MKMKYCTAYSAGQCVSRNNKNDTKATCEVDPAKIRSLARNVLNCTGVHLDFTPSTQKRF